MLMEPKFKVNLTGDLKAVEETKLFELGITESSLQEAKAKMLVPEDFDADRNRDVIPVVFSLAVVNQFNLNDDGMDAETALDALTHFKNKPINIEHKKDQIVGHIINASVSDQEPEFKERDLSKFEGKQTPFFITAAGLIYAQIFPDLAEAVINASDPAHETYKSISASWEVAFGNFDIVKSETHNLVDGVVLSEEDKEEEVFNLKGFGGSGANRNGDRLFRLIRQPAFPLGAALTLSPAAAVKGIFVDQSLLDLVKASENKKRDKISHLNEPNVRKVKSHIMDPEQFKQFLATVKESLAGANVSEANQKSLVSEITEAIKDRSNDWEAEQAKLTEAKTKVEEDLQEAQKELKAAQEKGEQTQKELDELKEKLDAQAKASQLQNRMKTVEDKFELSEKESEIVASELTKVGDAEDDFKTYMSKLDVIFEHKNKEAIAKRKAEEDNKENKEDKGNLDTSKANDTKQVPNSNKNQSEGDSLLDRIGKNFAVSYSGQKA